MGQWQYAMVGGGNMGGAMARGLVRAKRCSAAQVLMVEPDDPKRQAFAAEGFAVAAGVDDPRLGQARTLVLAVKPQAAWPIMQEIRPHLAPEQVVVSIMAGVTMAKLAQALGTPRVARAMPNTPAQIGLGLTVYYPDPSIAPEGLEAIEALLGACGAVVRAANEDGIDAATAVSGSGPAYVFYLAEHWAKAAEKLGFTPQQAREMVSQTLLGAVELMRASPKPPAQLRQEVTSKGGTTEAAITHLEAQGAGRAMEEAVGRAYARAKELAG